jgi:WD40 repeat protein
MRITVNVAFGKVWDTRERNAVARIPSHTQESVGGSSTAAVATLACTWSPAVQTGGGGVGGYILAGGSDSSVALIDPRVFSSGQGEDVQAHAIVDRWSHHNNGIYSMCVVGSHCLFTGDGAGLMNCYDIFDGANPLKYGLGASSQGAVQTITCVDGKIVAAGEDGNVLIFSYQ